MNTLATVPAVLAGLVLFLVPGLAILTILGKGRGEDFPLDERLFVAVGGSVAVSSWVALALAEAACFSTTRAALLAAGLSAALLLALRRRISWPLPLPKVGVQGVLTPGLLVVALLVQAHRSEYLVGGRDPGIYVATMALISRTGGISYVDPVVQSIPKEDVELFFRNPSAPDFTFGRFMGFPLERPSSARVFPEFFHLYPAFGAYAFEAAGVRGALATPVIFAVLGTLGAFLAFRRIFGVPEALLGTVLLATNVVQAWFARYPVSEPMSQFLMLFALLAFRHWEETMDGAWGALAGFLLGLTLLVRIDSILVLVPLILYVVVRRAQGKLPLRTAMPLLVPFSLLLGHTAFHAIFWARKYVAGIEDRRYWHHSPPFWLAAGALGALLVLLALRIGARIALVLEGREARFRRVLAGVVVVFALYASFLRPFLSAWAGGDGNAKGSALLSPGILVPLGFPHLAAHDAQSFVRLGWFVTPLGLALGVLGLVLAILDWRPKYLFPLLLASVFSGFYFYKIFVTSDYFFALRRYVPVILPFLFACAALVLVRVASRGLLGRVVAGAMAAFLLVSYLRDTIPVVRHVDWKGSVRFVDDLARRFGPDDVVIFEQIQSVHLLSIPLWAAYGVNIVELARFNPDPDHLSHLIKTWRTRYKNIYFVHTYKTNLCGLFLQRVEEQSFTSVEWERTYDRKPQKADPRGLKFTISRVIPPEELQVPVLREVKIGGTDDFQVSGFFNKEGGGDRTYRWTGSCASVYVPGITPGSTLGITASAGERPAIARPPLVKVALSGVVLGSFEALSHWGTYFLSVPKDLPPGPPVLRFDVPPWRPHTYLAGSDDTRELGVMVNKIEVRR